jgi:hypothetical protein
MLLDAKFRDDPATLAAIKTLLALNRWASAFA